MQHPEVATRSCEDCQRYLYRADGQVETRRGEKVRRPPGVLTPCRTCPKVPPDAEPVPASAVELSHKNTLAVLHYRRCKAVAWQVPDALDPLVRRNAAIIQAVEDLTDRQGAAELLSPLAALLGVKGP